MSCFSKFSVGHLRQIKVVLLTGFQIINGVNVLRIWNLIADSRKVGHPSVADADMAVIHIQWNSRGFECLCVAEIYGIPIRCFPVKSPEDCRPAQGADFYWTAGQQAMTWLAVNDITKMEPGLYRIDGERLMVKVQAYTTVPVEERTVEMHRRYIDLQCEIRGAGDVRHVPGGGPDRP